MECNRANLLVSVQLALLDVVTPALRVVSTAGNVNGIHLLFCYDGPISDLEYQLANKAAERVKSDFGIDLKLEIERLDAPEKPRYLNDLIFVRYEKRV